MEVIFLGTGTSQGVPMIGQDESLIDLSNSKNWRTRTSIHVVMDGFHIQVDASPEFRLQCVYNKVTQLDLFILTHSHSDHIIGMDDLRRFCELKDNTAIPVYSSPEHLERVKEIFPYAVRDIPLTSGYPAFKLNTMPEKLELPCGTIYSTSLTHGSMKVLGLVFIEKSSGKKLTYYCDCKFITDEQKELARGSDILIIDGLRYKPHPTHLSIDEAVEVINEVKAGHSYLIHMASSVDYETCQATLPSHISLSFDNHRVSI